MPVDLRGRKHRAVVLRESLEPAIPASICAAYLAFGDVVCAIANFENFRRANPRKVFTP
jgi:hypothetical protein